MLAGLDYPQSLLPIVLDRFRSDRRLTPARLGLVKGCINRHRRLAGGLEPEIAMSLDETSNEPGYLLGRLFALLREHAGVVARYVPGAISRRSAIASSARPR